MHKKWEELIPFYVTGMLSPAEHQQVEQHLATCESCQKDVDEWVDIANAVHAFATDHSKELPPLSAEVRYQVLRSSNSKTFGSNGVVDNVQSTIHQVT